MNDRHDLEIVLASPVPLVFIQTGDESRLLQLLTDIASAQPANGYRPCFRWSVTDGLQRLDLDLQSQRHNSAPENVLGHIRSVEKAAIYALLDFHPYLQDPVTIRLLKDIAIDARSRGTSVLLISHKIDIPDELRSMSASFSLSLPDAEERKRIVHGVVREHEENLGKTARVDSKALAMLIQNLSGLTHADTERLARNALLDDDAITTEDVPAVMQAKYDLLNSGGILTYEYDTVNASTIAGFSNVKTWLQQRRSAFTGNGMKPRDLPKGILLLGVQGCGKSLAAKAAAGILNVPLLRLDFGALYNKYHGETERNLRESLQLAEVMSPCVLWLDEIEKGLAGGNDETGTSRRVLATLLTWMAERSGPVLLVATANDVSQLAPELIRKGRFDEVFFVDLPGPGTRAEILSIHLRSRDLDPAAVDLPELVARTNGFSGAEIEQGIVSATYAALATRESPKTAHLVSEFRKTRPLSVLMSEKISALRSWSEGRTVPAEAPQEPHRQESVRQQR